MSSSDRGTKPQSPITIDADGTITVPSFRLPLSTALSPEASAYMAQLLGARPSAEFVNFKAIQSEAAFRAAVDAFRAALDEGVAEPLAQELLAAFPVDMKPARIGGVAVEEFMRQGERDDDRVLINLHGGAFYSGATYVGRIESIPLCHLGRLRVISVDYRQGYEHKYPAASEDVMAVYEALLRSYPPSSIGIYGGSAGGIVTLQATAWILAHGLPAPGAIGVFGAGAFASGDGSYFAAIGSAQHPPMNPIPSLRIGKFGYFSDARFDDPLLDPTIAEEAFRAKFPPSLLITGTRAFDLSPALATHRALSQAGAEASLHVFDGLGHCFYYQAGLPEGRDAYRTMVRFFRKHLGRRSPRDLE